jgi:hypothetical protein
MSHLYLRKVDHPQARNSYRVILKTEHDGEFEIGSIGIKTFTSTDDRWTWGIDSAIPMRAHETTGEGFGLKDCMRQFKASWNGLPPTRVTLRSSWP